MRMSCSLIVASVLLLPLQAVAQSGGASGGGAGSGGVGGSGSGTAGVTTGTATGTGSTTGTVGAPNRAPNLQMPGPPGVNSAGTAQSSGGSRTIGSASVVDPNADAKSRAEESPVDKKINGICRGC